MGHFARLLVVNYFRAMNNDAIKNELSFRTSRSSGAGGQHVNKTETKVELLFDISASKVLTADEKTLAIERLSKKMTKEGLLTVTNQSTRSQLENKERAIEDFFQLLEKSLIPPKKRKKVKLSKAEKEKRLAAKRQLSEKKSLRQKVIIQKEGDLCD
jgi:ribosome-associated protein